MNVKEEAFLKTKLKSRENKVYSYFQTKIPQFLTEGENGFYNTKRRSEPE